MTSGGTVHASAHVGLPERVPSSVGGAPHPAACRVVGSGYCDDAAYSGGTPQLCCHMFQTKAVGISLVWELVVGSRFERNCTATLRSIKHSNFVCCWLCDNAGAYRPERRTATACGMHSTVPRTLLPLPSSRLCLRMRETSSAATSLACKRYTASGRGRRIAVPLAPRVSLVRTTQNRPHRNPKPPQVSTKRTVKPSLHRLHAVIKQNDGQMLV